MENFIKSLIPKKNLPDFIIVGAQKSGTTSLHYYLNQHKKLIGSKPKELHFFDEPKENRKSIDWYKSKFTRTILNKNLFFESTPSYLYHRYVPKEIHKVNPNVKIIIILRNPIDRAYSAWNMYNDFFNKNKGRNLVDSGRLNSLIVYKRIFEGRENFLSFEELIELEIDLIKNNSSIEPAILRRGLYFEQITNYYSVFSKENVLVLFSEDLKKNTIDTVNKVCSFLNVSKFKPEELSIEPKHRRVYNKALDESVRNELKAYFSEPNDKLSKLLEKKINWD